MSHFAGMPVSSETMFRSGDPPHIGQSPFLFLLVLDWDGDSATAIAAIARIIRPGSSPSIFIDRSPLPIPPATLASVLPPTPVENR